MTKTRSKALLGRLRRVGGNPAGAVGAAGTQPAPAAAFAASASREPRKPAATLIVNPYSSGMTGRRERAIVTILRQHLELQVRRTERSGHAPALARHACETGTDIVIACGGDGTANEVLNGFDLAAHTAADRPMFALIPAGGTNVLCRSLGLPNHPIKATEHLVGAMTERRARTINLGRLDERIFMFSAGVGFDGELVRRAEQRRSGRRPGDLAHVAMIAGMFLHERMRYDERLTITVEEEAEQIRAAMMMVGNTSPVSYVGNLPIHLMPDCALDKGLDFIAPPRLNPLFLVKTGVTSAGKRKQRRSGDVLPDRLQHRHDIQRFTVACDEPTACQVDGEFIGERTHIVFETVPEAVRLVF